MGWAPATWAHGRGFATEGVRAALAWSDTHLPPALARRMICLIAPENGAPIRVAEKCGFHEAARATYGGTPTLVFERRTS